MLANDTDGDAGDKLITAATQPAHGTVAVAGDGSSLTYKPNPDYCNEPGPEPTDDFTYTITGGSEASVAVTVECADDNPVAVDDQATVAEDSDANAIDVLANDTDGDAGDKLITAATQPAHGTVAVAGDGSSLTYKPNPDYCNEPGAEPTDDFTYTITGGSEASVAVTVECSDDNPVAVDDQATVAEDSDANAIDVLANDTDGDAGDKLITAATQPAHGTVAVAGDGSSLTYKPNPDYCNEPGAEPTDDFTYTITGGSEASVAVTVECSDEQPGDAGDHRHQPEQSGQRERAPREGDPQRRVAEHREDLQEHELHRLPGGDRDPVKVHGRRDQRLGLEQHDDASSGRRSSARQARSRRARTRSPTSRTPRLPPSRRSARSIPTRPPTTTPRSSRARPRPGPRCGCTRTAAAAAGPRRSALLRRSRLRA